MSINVIYENDKIRHAFNFARNSLDEVGEMATRIGFEATDRSKAILGYLAESPLLPGLSEETDLADMNSEMLTLPEMGQQELLDELGMVGRFLTEALEMMAEAEDEMAEEVE